MSLASLDYQVVTDALTLSKVDMEASECHGTFCGVMCASGRLRLEAAATDLLGSLDSEVAGARDAVLHIGSLLSSCIAQFGDQGVPIELLLPDSEAPLQRRTTAMGLWCEGFVMGLSFGGIDDKTALKPDSKEILSDLTRIAHQLQHSDLQQKIDEEDETAFADIEHFISVGVMLIFEELHDRHPEDTIH